MEVLAPRLLLSYLEEYRKTLDEAEMTFMGGQIDKDGSFWGICLPASHELMAQDRRVALQHLFEQYYKH